MASHAPDFGRASALPLSEVLASIPSYPRPVIERLVASLIEHLDEQDGDPDLEDGDSDHCTAGDDAITAGPAICGSHGYWGDRNCVGMDEDLEIETWPTFGAQWEIKPS